MVSLRGGDDDDLASQIAQLELVPRRGRIKPLKTIDEVRAGLETFQVYVVELPQKFAATIKNVIQDDNPDLKSADIQHLRRVVKFQFLPLHLQKTFKTSRGVDDESSDPAPLDLENDLLEDDLAEDEDTVRYFVVAPITAIERPALLDTLRRSPPFSDRRAPPKIFTVTVPALAPTSAEQAAAWSEQYWPIAYKNTNPFGPHPSLVARNTAEIQQEAGDWLALAQSAGDQLNERGLGEKVGCVVVDNSNGKREIVSVAGDCRWRTPTGEAEAKGGPGNVMAHAVQRAIAMVARKRLQAEGKNPDTLDRSLFCDSPLTELETKFYNMDNTNPSGYLCVDLDIYITHEPCVMCSMAILHSRFKRCVFGRRMPHTGGLTADTTSGKVDIELGKGLGHGIFWRPSDLNWKLLAWEWEDDHTADGIVTTSIPDTLQA